MLCPHCQTETTSNQPFDRPLDGGHAFAQSCSHCGGIVSLRPRESGDPPVIPADLSAREIEHLRFERWRLHETGPKPEDQLPSVA